MEVIFVVMFGSSHYVPIILLKQGEKNALARLADDVKGKITPIFAIPPIDWDFENDQPKMGANDHVAKIPDQLLKSWGTTPAFIDTLFLADNDYMSNGSHPLTWLINEAAKGGLKLIPVTSPSRSQEHVDAILRLEPARRDEICLRLPVEDWPTIKGYEDIDNLLNQCGLNEEQVHLVLDLGDSPGSTALPAIISEINNLRTPDKWKTLTVTSSSMPFDTPTGAGVHVVPRNDWLLYKNILKTGGIKRIPAFGDYAIASPTLISDVDPRIMNISATIRYTVDDAWLISKGGLFKGNGGRSIGGAAVPPACTNLVNHNSYSPNHCSFEDWIISVSNNHGSPGNPSTWRNQGTYHHLVFVTEQIANLSAP